MTGKVLMVQGTTSHAGKSVLTAAICHIYARRGLKVAPFKAQNMALNSFVTPEGGEIGRAQAYQAQAAGIEPHVDMNPILLKPNSETGSQVIVLGKPVGNMKVREYHAYQTEVWPTVTAALDRLRVQNDLVVVEGAGSPAEINLRDRDIVNMAVARYARSPVLLVGDIDRGGVFASLYGTVELVTEEERALIRGFVINKFRGDATLLDSGLEFLTQKTGIPTLGVLPYLKGWKGDEEDSLGMTETEKKGPQDLKIVVVKLPFISNFTDFDALAREPDVELLFVDDPEACHDADALIVPGTKSTMADLRWLRERGFQGAIRTLLKRMVPVVGVCGGYQMLGRKLHDPHGVESGEREADGLWMLDVETEFLPTKRTVRACGKTLTDGLGEAGCEIFGYEIHMGISTLVGSSKPFCELTDSQGNTVVDGAVTPDGLVTGTYLHGVFDSTALRRGWLNTLRTNKGLEPLAAESIRVPGISDMANLVESHLDMRALDGIVLG